ncbi:MAG: hypothetical protein RL326_2238 [Pseudomonadota bacterium]
MITRDIHRALRRLQIKNRRVRKGAEIPVSIAETHALIELHAGGDLSVNDLAAALLIPQSQVSRVLQKLRARRFIHQREDPSDYRRSLSSLSRAGLGVIERIDEVMGGIYQECVARLSGEDVKELSRFLESIAHGLGCPLIRRRDSESRLRAAHRQMARVFGLLGANVYDSGLTRSQWAIWESLFRAPAPLNATILERYLGIKPAIISEILNRYEVQGYLERTRSSENHRVNLIRLTPAGRHQFTLLETRAVSKLRRALRGTSLTSRKKLLELLNRFAGELGANSIFLDKTLQTSQITDPGALMDARGFTLRQIVRLGWELSAPDPIFPSGHEIWALTDRSTDRSELRGVCVAKRERGSWLVSVSVWDSGVDTNQARAFIQHAHHLSNLRGKPDPIAITFEPLKRLYPKSL